MATVISKAEAYSHMIDILDRALGGEEISIEQGGSIRLKLVPVEASAHVSPSRRAGTLAGRIVETSGVWDPLTDAELAEMGL